MKKNDNISPSNEVESLLIDFRNKTGLDISIVLNDFLDYIIGYLDPTCTPIEGWSHSEDENKMFYNIMINYFSLIDERLSDGGWYDAFGDIIMSIRANGGGFEQYFTPPSICEVVTKVVVTNDIISGGRYVISDPSCGSSRNLLAVHTKLSSECKKSPYIVAEDIDILCCKMSAVNLAIHGCFGEVVCHDTIAEPHTIRNGFLINHLLYENKTIFPTIVRTNVSSEFLFGQKIKLKEPIQLTLF